MKSFRSGWAFIGALFAALLASACCLLPLMLVFVGVSGAWVSNLQALEPFRPFFVLLALGALSYGIYREIQVSRVQAACACEVTLRDKVRRGLLGLGVVLTLLALAFPYLAGNAVSRQDNPALTIAEAPAPRWQVVTLEVEGMTCGGCVLTVEHALDNLPGVKDRKVTLEPPRAMVVINTQEVQPEAVARAVTEAGYPARVLETKEIKL